MKRKHTSHSNKNYQSSYKKKKPPLTLQQRKDKLIRLIDIIGYNMLMDTYIKDGRPEEAIITFDSLLAREHQSSIKPNAVAYNTVINAHIELGQFLKGTERYTEMINRGIIPDVQTITTIMKLYMRLKKPNDVIDCFDFFKEYNLKPNVVSYNTLMDAHIEKADYTEAINVFEVMQDNDVLPNTVTITTMMKLYLKVNEAHNAILIHGLFKKYNIPQDEYSFTALIKAYNENRQYNKAIEVFHQMQSRSDVKINEVTISSMMHLYNKMNRPDKTIDTFELYQRYNIEPGIYAYNCLINAYERQNNIKAACDTIRMLHSKGIKCDSYTFQPVLKHYQYRGDKRRFYKVWDAMISKKYNVRPDRFLYSIKDKLDQFRGPPLDERPCGILQRYGNCRKRNCLFKH